VGALAILEKRTKTDLAISGMLLFLSFADPRFSFATVLGLVFLFCIRRLRLPDLGVVTLALLGALGPEIPHVAYKTIVGAIGNVSTVIQIDKGINTQLLGLAEAILHLDSNVVLLAGLGAFAFLLAVANVGSSQELFKQDTGLWDLEEVEHTHISLKASGLEIASYEADDIIIPILGLITLVYIILYSYGKLGPPLWGLLNSGFFGFFNYLVLRYHVVLLLGIFTLYSYRKSGRLSLALAFVLGLSLIGLLFRLDAPLLITLTALPALQHISQSRHHIAKIMVLCFLCLGVFSGTFYAATATSVSSDPRYDDLPHILPILFTIKGGENVYTPSSYSYYARRLLSFAQLRLDTKNSSCSYWLIDINFISKAKLQEILSDKTFEVLYAGDSFVLLKR